MLSGNRYIESISEFEAAAHEHARTPRRGYMHHGIYVGEGKVVHYAGLGCGQFRGPIVEVPLARGREPLPDIA
jgi:hypothetical protein